MISVKEAKQIIAEHCKTADPVDTVLENACGKILAADIFSGYDIPAFPQSSMDGYAFNFAGYLQHRTLKITGETAAGDQNKITLQPNETTRIFTGAPVAEGADTVIMQEKTGVENGLLILKDDALKPGTNVRLKGAEIKKDELALEKGSLITPTAIGFLAGIGISSIPVYPFPTVSIIVTGNELQKPGVPLTHGQVYESNAVSLKSSLQQLGAGTIKVFEAKDDLAELTRILQGALDQSDLILLTGGVSVGDYDFVLRAAENLGIEKLFHRIKQKPGKPLFFGKKGNKLVFGLPGNPSSVLTCFYQYVVLALQQMETCKGITQLHVPLARPFAKAPGLTHFLKGLFDGEKVTPLTAQESFRMRSFAKANCLIEIDEETSQLDEGTPVNIYLLPGY